MTARARDAGMRRTVSWKPLLEGAEREAALRVVGHILEDLPRFPVQGPLAASLMRGQTGLAILFAYHARAFPGSPSADKAEALLEEATEALATTTLLPDLYDGFPGIAWALQHVRGTPESPDEDPLTDIDAALAEFLQTRPWTHRYDLVSGLAGLGAYALERLPRPGARQCLEQVVARLGELAEPVEDGVRWKTPPWHIAEEARAHYPQGGFNLGVAHGIPAVLGVLAEAVAAGVAEPSARKLLQGGWTWLMRQRAPDDAAARFPTRLDANGEPHGWPGRPAWCYGDPGIALTLHGIARAVGNADWEREALALCRESVERWSRTELVRDACLCHGAAGLAHLYNRLFQTTGERIFEDAARRWLHHALSLRKPDVGIGGFQTLESAPGGGEEWTDLPGLLAGATGIALVLLAVATPVEPGWDRLLLMSPPPFAPARS
ncbi:lanthionine synthetase C family protein [Pyxidicoccus parkwayensis]|uniref:Lanthionine synthetase C family protein n=1 Tax=Pyxidicoccus parkwayensis TaxID=2813578 RepID=A0ABX7NNF7_9BACT|nr:lanthionine synthetase C family protein [Pyxidicoccus parkwaysis]QSQ18946.1 lanthionine synthetase C family protein [Pyxidicoccus parkwaysis]